MNNQNLLQMFKRVGLLLVLAIAISPTVTWAALNAFLTITGATQGVIEGDVTEARREGSIKVVRFGHNVSQAFDAASGLTSGERQHRPIRIVKEVDQSSPKLFNALTANELLTEFAIRFWRPSGTGAEIQYYTVELVNARVVSIMPSHSSLAMNANELVSLPLLETVTFVYDKIIVTWEDGGITAEDDWQTPTP